MGGGEVGENVVWELGEGEFVEVDVGEGLWEGDDDGGEEEGEEVDHV